LHFQHNLLTCVESYHATCSGRPCAMWVIRRCRYRDQTSSTAWNRGHVRNSSPPKKSDTDHVVRISSSDLNKIENKSKKRFKN
jgi:hypothetical protein